MVLNDIIEQASVDHMMKNKKNHQQQQSNERGIVLIQYNDECCACL